MIICHLCLNGPYNENWNYQENILPKYHAKQGHTVYQIVTPYMWKGTEQVISPDKEYINDYGVHIIRMDAHKGIIGGTRFNRYPKVKKELEKISPDILFIHDVQCLDMTVVAEYLRDNEPSALCERYKLEADAIKELQGYELVELIGRKRGMLISGGETDTGRAASTLLDEFRSATLGRLTLDHTEDYENVRI